MKEKIIISGYGGQGVMLAGTLLCSAAMIDGKFVTFFPSYGAEIRGGTANCQVIISDNPIGSPVVYEPDILISLNKPSFNKFLSAVKKDGIILVNTSLFDPPKISTVKLFKVPANNIAEKCGNHLVLNVVMLGALIFEKKIVKLENLLKSIPEVLKGKKEKIIKLNIEAANTGYRYLQF